MREEAGLDHFEGRSWRGFHHHAATVLLADGFLLPEADRRPAESPDPGGAGKRGSRPAADGARDPPGAPATRPAGRKDRSPVLPRTPIAGSNGVVLTDSSRLSGERETFHLSHPQTALMRILGRLSGGREHGSSCPPAAIVTGCGVDPLPPRAPVLLTVMPLVLGSVLSSSRRPSVTVVVPV